MKVIEFDINKGIYQFALGAFSTLMHRHPAVEIIHSTHGVFSIETEFEVYSDLTFALIDANVLHKVLVENGEVELLMMECEQSLLQDFLEQEGIILQEGIFAGKRLGEKPNLLSNFQTLLQQNTFFKTKDERH